MTRFSWLSVVVMVLSLSALGQDLKPWITHDKDVSFLGIVSNTGFVTASTDGQVIVWNHEVGASLSPIHQIDVGQSITIGVLSKSRNVAFLGTGQGDVIAIDLNKGVELWHFQMDDDERNSRGGWPMVTAIDSQEGLVGFGTLNGQLFFIDADSGLKLMSFTETGLSRSNFRFHDEVQNDKNLTPFFQENAYNLPRIGAIRFLPDANEVIVGGWEMPVHKIRTSDWSIINSFSVGPWGADDVIVFPETFDMAVIGTDGYRRINYQSNKETQRIAFSDEFSGRQGYEHWKNRIKDCFRRPMWGANYLPFGFLTRQARGSINTIVATKSGDVAFTFRGEVWLAKSGDIPTKSEAKALELFHFSDVGLVADIRDEEEGLKASLFSHHVQQIKFNSDLNVISRDTLPCQSFPELYGRNTVEVERAFRSEVIQGRPFVRRKILKQTIWTPSLKFNTLTGEVVNEALPKRGGYNDGYNGVTIGGRYLRHFHVDSVWANDTDTIPESDAIWCATGWGGAYVVQDFSKQILNIRRWPQVELDTLKGYVRSISPDSTKLFITVSLNHEDSSWVDSGSILRMPAGIMEKIPMNLSNCNMQWARALFRSDSEEFILIGGGNGGAQMWHCSTMESTSCQEIRLPLKDCYLRNIETPETQKLWFQAKSYDGFTSKSKLLSYDWDSHTLEVIPQEIEGNFSFSYDETAGAFVGESFKALGGDSVIVLWPSSHRLEVITGEKMDWGTTFLDDHTLAIERFDGTFELWDVSDRPRRLYTYLPDKRGEWVVYDEFGRYDGSMGVNATKQFIAECEDAELLQQPLNSLYTPGLVNLIMSESQILEDLPTLSDIDLCGRTPVLTELSSNEGDLRFEVRERLGGLGEIEVRVDGVQRGQLNFGPDDFVNDSHNAKLFELDIREYEKFASDSLSFDLELVPRTTDGQLEGRRWGREFEISEAGRRERQQPKFYGVFLGVNDNPAQDELAPLSFAVDDAQSVHEMMGHAASGFFENRVETWLLSDSPQADDMATEEAFGRVMSEIATKSKPNDVLMLYFAGHGVLNEDQRFIFLTSEAYRDDLGRWSGLDMDELKEQLSQIKANNRFLVFDACHSGAVTNQFDVASRGASAEAFYLQKELARLGENQKLAILAASAPTQKAYEPPELKHGLLTFHLLSAMGNQNSERANYLDVNNWLDQTRLGVERYSDKTTFKGAQNPSVAVDETFTVGKLDDSLRNRLADFQPVTVISRFNVTLPSGDAAAEKGLRRRVEESFKLHQSDDATHPIYDQNRLDGVEIDLRFVTDKRGKKTTLTLVVSRSSLVVTTEGGKVDLTDPDDIRRKIVMALREVKE